mgnify:CR=1 FL=1
MLYRRHINEISARQSDVRSDTSTFLRDRFFCDLNKNFLPFLQQISDQWLRPSIAASTTTVVTAFVSIITATFSSAFSSANAGVVFTE